MKIIKMREKIEKIFDENSNKLKAFYSGDGISLFCINPYMYYRLPETSIYTAHVAQIGGGEALLRVDSTAGKPVKDDTTPTGIYNPYGDIITPGKLKCSKRNVLRAYNGQHYVYFDKKFTRGFPKNTIYFSSGKKDGITAAIIEGSTVYAFAVIMPINVINDADFIPDTVTA
jgi:hypothetical protein